MTASGGSPARRQSWIGYVVGGVVFALAAATAILVAGLGIKGMVDRVDDLQRAPASEAGGTVVLAEPGGYSVYFEAAGVNSGLVEVPTAALQPLDGAAPVDLRDYSSDFTYDFGGHEGLAVATFRLDRPGRYRLRASGAGGNKAELAVGRSLGDGLGRAFARAAAIGGFGLLLGGGIAVWTAIRQFRTTTAPPPR